MLVLSVSNAYSGVTVVTSGVLRLSSANISALGAMGAGNETYVGAGATLDFAGAYSAASGNEDLFIAGSGVGDQGALINSGAGHINKSFRNLTLTANATIGGPGRLDLNNAGYFAGNGFTLTKAGAMEMGVSRYMSNCTIVIDGGLYTIQHAGALGGTTPGDTTVNGGRLNCWGNYSIAERVIFNGGGLSQGNSNTTFNLTGNLTFNSNIVVNSGFGRLVQFSGVFDGAGGLTNMGNGTLILSSDTIGYSGATVNNGGSYLYIGRSGGTTGWLGAGEVVNNGNLIFDRSNAYTFSNHLSGTGGAVVRQDGAMTLAAGAYTNGSFRVADGALNLSAGASLFLAGDMIVADRQGSFYTIDPTSVVAAVNIPDGAALTARSIIMGNGTVVTGGSMLGFIHQSGGAVQTTGTTAEDNGLRLGHYPQAFGTYHLSGGTLTVGGGYDLGIATDGTGWVHQTGGEIFATRVMLNERNNTGGYGRLTVEGGVLNVGAGGITRDPTAPYLVEYGGAGGVVRATAAFSSPLDATLSGTGASAITFDTAGYDVSLSGVLSGAGGLNKGGGAAMSLTGNNTYAGGTVVSNGVLLANNAAGSGTGSGAVNVLAGGTLGGTGAIAGAVTIADNGTLAPGASAGTLTINGPAAFSPQTLLKYELGTTSDLTVISGDLALNGRIEVTDSGAFGVGEYTLIQYSGALSGSLPTVSSMPAGFGGAVDTNTPGAVKLLVSVSSLTPYEQWQMDYFGSTSDPNAAPDADPDHDRTSNETEFGANTNPTNPASALLVVQVQKSGDDFVVTWTAAGVRTNQLQAASTLVNGPFSDVGTPVILGTPGDAVTNAVDPGAATNPSPRFYRIRVEP